MEANLNELTSAAPYWNNGVTSVMVSGNGLASGAADLYADGSWARTGATPADGQNTYTASAQDTALRTSQDSVTVNLPASPSFSYDGNGNLLSDGQRYFEYDWENQLTNVYVSGQWRSEFAYDGLMRRRVRKEFTWSGGAWVKTNEVRYVYDDRLVLQERDSNNVPLVSYTRGTDLSGELEEAGGIGGLLARTDVSVANGSTADAYYHCDGNGNVTCLIDYNNLMAARYSYDPYGNILAMSGPMAGVNLYRFSSKEYHANSGTVYYLYRFYDPNLQRWLNRDPIREKGGFNLFGFVRNSPLILVDPLGLNCCGCMDAEGVYHDWTHLWDPPRQDNDSISEDYGPYVAVAAIAALPSATATTADYASGLWQRANLLAVRYPRATRALSAGTLFAARYGLGYRELPQPQQDPYQTVRQALNLAIAVAEHIQAQIDADRSRQSGIGGAPEQSFQFPSFYGSSQTSQNAPTCGVTN